MKCYGRHNYAEYLGLLPQIIFMEHGSVLSALGTMSGVHLSAIVYYSALELAASKLEREVHRRFVLHTVRRQGPAVLQLRAIKDQPLLPDRNAFLPGNAALQLTDRVRGAVLCGYGPAG